MTTIELAVCAAGYSVRVSVGVTVRVDLCQFYPKPGTGSQSTRHSGDMLNLASALPCQISP